MASNNTTHEVLIRIRSFIPDHTPPTVQAADRRGVAAEVGGIGAMD